MKITQHIALKWAKQFQNEINMLNISANDLSTFLSPLSNEKDKINILMRNQTFSDFIELADKKYSTDFDEFLSDLKSVAVVNKWSHNKQIFKFDKDFIKTLSNTSNLSLVKDCWDYLPCKCFYIDLSENEDICNSIIGKGIFIEIFKVEEMNKWQINAIKVTDSLYFCDTMTIENVTDVVPDDAEILNNGQYRTPTKNEVVTTIVGIDKVEKKTFNAIMYRILLVQILNYLSQDKPDVDESEDSKVTYRTPAYRKANAENVKPKNKFSEIRQWNVGYYYGSEYRKRKVESEKNTVSNVGSVGSGAGVPKRPHSRKAHWHNYQYRIGTDEKRNPIYQLKPIFLSEMQIGTKKNDFKSNSNPAVIHKCFKDYFEEETNNK